MNSKLELLNRMNKLLFYKDYYNEFIKNLSNNQLNNLNQLGLVLIAPESFKLGIIDDILTYLKDYEIVVIDAAIIDRFNEEHLAEFIPESIPKFFRWWLIEQRYTKGPIGALLVCPKKELEITTLEKLKEIKGYRLPSIAEQYTLRSRLPSVNGLLNLIHTPDDVVHLIRDLSPFFSMDKVTRALNIIPEIQTQKNVGLSIHDIKNYYFSGYLTKNRYYYNLFATLYLQFLHRLISIVLLNTNKSEETILEIQKVVNEGLNRQQNIQGTRHLSLKELENTLNKIKNLYLEFNENIFTEKYKFMEVFKYKLLWEILYDLINLQDISYKNWQTVFYQLKQCDVYITEWEELVLVSTLFQLIDQKDWIM
ncbi:nucleoside-diphosphate kinase [Evansella sp. AB-P1]|uniref:nucleoside-diphosphate kinase n=1 Tax=Evansella sp. AB-P1 TaxID=3037653 RepID=UPI00241C7297|nr:nucleoside-diphosphate kinase [Evansella sp. AB-P1]MDG5788617.1 nucleoside-diphosphate kinase [Evansella sp. AB-P1]